MRTSTLTRLLPALLLALPLLVLPAAPADAHADVLSTLPADMQELETAPERLEVAFNETVTMPDDGLRLIDESGQARQLPFRLQEAVSGTVAVADPELLPDGWYALTWRAISADGHPIDGSIRFRVLSDADAEGPPAPPTPLLAEPSLVTSFPRQASELRYPPREARLVFDREIRVADLAAFLVFEDGSSEQLQRLSSGTATEVLLRLPVLSPGSYRLGWELSAGPEGSLRFSVAASITSPGGGNHRHSTDDMYLESFSSWLPRALLLALAGLLLGVWSRTRSAAGREMTVVDVLGPRVLAAAVAVTAVVGVGTAVVEGLVRFHDHPLEGVLAADAVWVYTMVLLVGVALAVSGRSGPVLPAAALTVTALVWSIGPFLQFRYGPLVPLAGATTYLSLTLFFLLLTRHLSRMVDRRWVIGSLLLLAVSSSLLLFATAQTFDLLGNFAWEWSVRWRLMLLASPAAAAWYWSGSRGGVLYRILTVVLALMALLGVWMPPPAPGI